MARTTDAAMWPMLGAQPIAISAAASGVTESDVTAGPTPAGVTADTENLYGRPASNPPTTRSVLPLAFEIMSWPSPVKVYLSPRELLTMNASTAPWHTVVCHGPKHRALFGAYQIRLTALFPG